ncbi:MmcQ/YjbR family DNA-binding protein [Deinococcus sp. Leaf326]|uniref:MmcQ/YjbR family DNA-binding protein n=1 Tax=Deinococcus sp. Leaf326 TaxID=1736338 RepID=UPI0006F3AFB2|nr:MmcQ/YjbR family DNA-binding protein [Deinococcus sp. Leaf326]KQR04729.1 MmcQ-like protein [Deinococcus sp. Leaf326]
MQTVAELRAACAELRGSQETFPFGASTLVFKVAGRMYALTDLGADPLTLSLKVRPERGEALRAEYPGIVPGYHLNKRHWVTLTLDAVPQALATELLRGSYALVVAGLTREQRRGLEETAAE